MAQKVKAKMPAEGQQACLDLWPREHDLPPRWDGLPVQWGDWSDTADVIICPPPRRPERCDHCGVTVACLINIGRIWTDEASAPAATAGHVCAEANTWLGSSPHSAARCAVTTVFSTPTGSSGTSTSPTTPTTARGTTVRKAGRPDEGDRTKVNRCRLLVATSTALRPRFSRGSESRANGPPAPRTPRTPA